MKEYYIEFQKNDKILYDSSKNEIGRIITEFWIAYQKNWIIYKNEKYDINHFGFLFNNNRLKLNDNTIFFTDIDKNRIIRSGDDVKIYYFKIGRKSRLIENRETMIEISTKFPFFGFGKTKYKISTTEIFKDELLLLFFLYYSSRDFGSAGGASL